MSATTIDTAEDQRRRLASGSDGQSLFRAQLAPGKAAALSSYLAQGGNLRHSRGKGFVYRSGAVKGLTQDQAVARFQSLWGGVDQSIRDKYSRIGSMGDKPGGLASGFAAPIAAPESKATPVPVKSGVPGATVAPKATYPGVEKDIVDAEPKPGSDEARRRAIEVNKGNENLRTAFTFPGSSSELLGSSRTEWNALSDIGNAAAFALDYDPELADVRQEKRSVDAEAARKVDAENKAKAEAATNARVEAERVRLGLQKKAQPTTPTPMGPPIPPGVQSNRAVAPITPPTTAPPTTAPAATPASVALPAGVTGPPAPRPALAGTRVEPIMGLTGLPKGWLPGDTLPSSASPEMQRLAAESNARTKAGEVAAMSQPKPTIAAPIKPAYQTQLENDRAARNADMAARRHSQLVSEAASYAGPGIPNTDTSAAIAAGDADRVLGLKSGRIAPTPQVAAPGQMTDAELYGTGPTAGGNYQVGDTTRRPDGSLATVTGVRPAVQGITPPKRAKFAMGRK